MQGYFYYLLNMQESQLTKEQILDIINYEIRARKPGKITNYKLAYVLQSIVNNSGIETELPPLPDGVVNKGSQITISETFLATIPNNWSYRLNNILFNPQDLTVQLGPPNETLVLTDIICGNFEGIYFAVSGTVEGVIPTSPENSVQIAIVLRNPNGTTEVVAFDPIEYSKKIYKQITSDYDAFGIKKGDNLLGLDLTEFTEKFLTGTFPPQITEPSWSITNNAGLRKVGDSSPFNVTFNFNRGNIFQSWNNVNIPRTGIAFDPDGTPYMFTYTGGFATSASNTANISIVAVQGLNTITGTVKYLAGPQPVNNKGVNVGIPSPAATSPNRQTSFEGVYPIFATTTSIVATTEQPLVSMLTGNNININLFAESGGLKQTIEFPQSWLDARGLQDIQYFNGISNQFDILGKISDFTQESITKTVNAVSVPYRRYTYNNPSPRGQLLIRFVF